MALAVQLHTCFAVRSRRKKEGVTVMKRRILLVGLALMLALSMLVVGCGSDGAADDNETTEAADTFSTLKPGVLVIGSDCDYPPFIELDADGNPAGFEYDMMLAIAEELGVEIEYLAPQNFDTLIPQIVGGGKMDIAVSSFTITPERMEEVDFSSPYFVDGVNQAITVPVDSDVASRDDFAGKKVGVQAGTTGGDWAEENLIGAEIVPFTNITDAFNAMMAGKVDGCVNDLPAAEGLIQKSFDGIKVLESAPTAEEYGIVVAKDNPKLTAALNDAIAKLIASGKMDEITAKWIN
jgi:polar amino acid transport system substrate-binding protein